MAKKKVTKRTEAGTESHRTASRQYARRKSDAVAEIGPPPKADAKLVRRYRHNLWLFLSECFPDSISQGPLSPDHKLVIDRIQDCIEHGGKDVNLMPRGFVKSSIIEGAAIWAAGFGHRKFFVPLAATDELADVTLASIQSELAENDELMKVFPAVCHCVRKLEGTPARAARQCVDGVRTHIEVTSQRCIFPMVKGFAGSGAIIWPRSIVARGLRGTRHKSLTGAQLRPDFICGDDLQTDDSATSPSQTTKRLNILKRTVLRMGSHSTKIAVVINGTIIENGDLIDQLADRELNPSWRTVKVGMLKSLPTNMKLWTEDYKQLRNSYDPNSPTDKHRAECEANAFYLANRDAMDEGAVATWEQCYIKECEDENSEPEISAIQHAMNIVVDDGLPAFMAECQNEPEKNKPTGIVLLDVKQIMAKVAPAPVGANTVTAFIDVSEQVMYYECWAWTHDGSGYQVAGGTYPDQGRPNGSFPHRDPPVPFSTLFHGTVESQMQQGLTAMLHGHKNWPGILNMAWDIHSERVNVKLCGIDVNGKRNEMLMNLIANFPIATRSRVYGSIGRGIVAAKPPITVYKQYIKNHGVENWYWSDPSNTTKLRTVIFSANDWKTRLHQRLGLPPFMAGGLHLNPDAKDLQVAAEHYLSETVTEVTAVNEYGTRTVIQFDETPNPNHRFDCFVGNLVAASVLGVGRQPPPPRKKKRPTTYF